MRYVDLPVYGAPMHLAWKKHRMRCPNVSCETKTWVLSDYRIAAKGCLLTTRAAKWATVQVGIDEIPTPGTQGSTTGPG